MSAQPTSIEAPRKELTLRGLIIGILITLVFTAANVYFGLKAGLTFATSIPAAVISMAVLRYFKGATMQENNIVQTVASAAGTLSSIIFVLPGLILIGWWTGFNYWTSFAICALGGILGVMYSIPLRRALVTNSDLPYPEGVACAEVLKVGAGTGEGMSAEEAAESNRAGLLAVLWGSIVSAAFAIVVATRVFAGDVVNYFRVRSDGGVTGFDFFLSFALFGIGHLVGLWVGIAMLVGALIGWGWGVPHFSALAPAVGSIADLANATWSHKVRFVGAGTIGVAAIWTLAKLVKPVISGLGSAMAASRARNAGNAASLPRTEQDIPIGQVGLISLACLFPIGWLIANFAMTAGHGLSDHIVALVVGGLIFVVLMSFFVSAVCGYMAGLIGSSNSPLSGIGIIVVISAALLLMLGLRSALPADSEKALVAFALFITSIVFAAAAIANNNLQDLKTGQLVDATPSKQQWALVIGVLAGAAIIPPILDLLNHAYGFVGAPGAPRAHALAAPQAGLISALAQGVIQHNIDGELLEIGGAIGVLMIIIDEVLRRTTKSAHLSPLAVGLGIYLPTQSTLMVVVGAVAGWWFDRRADRSSKNPEATKQLGVLLASGMIVGEGLLGVAIAAFVAFSGKDYPLALVGDSFAGVPAMFLGGAAFIAVMVVLYRWVGRLGQSSGA
ncbi:oligopeptide transporter, OPT family [Rhodanobacter sp. L36]|uniref:OPT family oligopeptide transporter n=1 Tax=Rhodanobacter sp. L36 TaxID=1747221 RepID=UPI00131BFF4F|nr:oligopeptide transporter, OPT family [Rhodanobacter sp. L36]